MQRLCEKTDSVVLRSAATKDLGEDFTGLSLCNRIIKAITSPDSSPPKRWRIRTTTLCFHTVSQLGTEIKNYGFVRPKHIYLDRVSDDVTAENILAMAIKWFYLRKAEAYLKTQLQNVDLEIGDLIGLSDQLREGTYFLYGIDTN